MLLKSRESHRWRWGNKKKKKRQVAIEDRTANMWSTFILGQSLKMNVEQHFKGQTFYDIRGPILFNALPPDRHKNFAMSRACN